MKLKIEVKLWNNYSHPTHTSKEMGGGVIKLTLHPKTITNWCKIVQAGTTKCQKDIVSENKPVWIT